MTLQHLVLQLSGLWLLSLLLLLLLLSVFCFFGLSISLFRVFTLKWYLSLRKDIDFWPFVCLFYFVFFFLQTTNREIIFVDSFSQSVYFDQKLLIVKVIVEILELIVVIMLLSFWCCYLCSQWEFVLVIMLPYFFPQSLYYAYSTLQTKILLPVCPLCLVCWI